MIGQRLKLPQDLRTIASPVFDDLTLTGGDIVAQTATTWNVLNTVATTINIGGAATQVSITTTGVGIGTTGPGAKLDIVRPAGIAGLKITQSGAAEYTDYFANISGNNPQNLLKVGSMAYFANTGVTLSPIGNGNISGLTVNSKYVLTRILGGADYIPLSIWGMGTGNTAPYFTISSISTFNNTSADIFIVDKSGNVGIGTTLVAAGVTYQKLSVNGSQLFVGADSTQESPMFQIVPSYVVNTHASYTTRTIFSQWAIAGAQEVVRFESGAAAMIGFLGAGAVIRQTGYAVPTDLATCITALTALRTALINYGLHTTV